MTRTYAVTGAASGMGKAIANLLDARGGRVIRCDLQEGDVQGDLSSPDGRANVIAGIEAASEGRLDGLILCAGIARFLPATVSINYFGVIDLLYALRPLLARSTAGRAAVITSLGGTFDVDDEIVEACLAGDEPRARAAAARLEGNTIIYTSTKRAVQQACRKRSVEADWAGAGVLLNMIAPGIIDTPMMDGQLRDPATLTALETAMPLATGRFGSPEEVAHMLAFLVSAENSLMVGQQIFLDCGSDAVRRPNHL